jgi:hypothetical protein
VIGRNDAVESNGITFAFFALLYGKAGTIQLNHEWTRMITNENTLILMTALVTE